MIAILISAIGRIRAAAAALRDRQAVYDELRSFDRRALAEFGLTRADIPYLFARAIDDDGTAALANDNHPDVIAGGRQPCPDTATV